MIKLKLKYEDGKAITATIPSNWNEVTVRQFEDLGFSTLPKDIDPIKAISILAQIPFDDLTVIEGDLRPILAVSSLLENAPDLSIVKKEDYFKWEGKTYFIEDFNKMNMKEVIQFMQTMEENYAIGKNIAKLIDPDDPELTDKILDSPFRPLYPAISFFLRKQVNLILFGNLNLN